MLPSHTVWLTCSVYLQKVPLQPRPLALAGAPPPGESEPASRLARPIKLYDLRRRVTRGAEAAAV